MPQAGKVRRREEAVAALLTSSTLAEAANKSGVSLSTLRRWLQQDSEFQKFYAKAKAEVVTFAQGALKAAMQEAVSTLRSVARSGPPAARVSAARALLEFAEDRRDDSGQEVLRELLRESTAEWKKTNAQS